MHIFFNDATIHVRVQGSGAETLVLLHGYLESLEVWNGFARDLAGKYRVVMVDLPGHGLSGQVSPVHDMDLLAQAVHTVLDALNISRCFLAGHSMGGYVALACLEAFPEYFKGVCLLHSTPFADTPEKQRNRDREIGLIREGKLPVICQVNIPNGFAPAHLETMKAEVDRVTRIAAASSPEGTIALLEGLKTRPDRQALFQTTRVPLLLILGLQDNYIDFQTMLATAQTASNVTVVTLEHSGHNGFIEEPVATIRALSEWMAHAEA
jgi:pimeloyl-ACP methyl ester carboxylesterase